MAPRCWCFISLALTEADTACRITGRTGKSAGRHCFPITGLRKRLAELLEQYADRRTTCNDLITNGVDHAFAQSNLPEVLAMLREAYPNTEFLHTGIQDYVDAVCAAHKEGTFP